MDLRALWVRWILVVAGLSVGGACTVSHPHKPEPSVSIARAPSPPVIHPAPPPISEVISLGDPDDKKPLKTEVKIYPGSGTFVKPQGGYKGPPPSDDRGEYTLNFENTDLQEVVKAVLGDLLKENYFIDPKVAGTTTIQTTRPLKRHELLPTLENLLRLNGASLLRAEGMYKILPSAQAARGSPPSSVSRLAAARGFTIRVVPLRYASARELHKLIEPFLPQDAPQIVDAQRNLLILTGSEQEIQAAVELVELFDADWLSGMSMALFKLQHAEVKTLHGELEKIFGEKDSPLAGVVRMVPVERLNALLVVSSRPGYLDQARNWIERLDQIGDSVSPRLYVYRVQNGKAADLAAVLGGIFGAEAKPSEAGAPPPEFAPGETQTTLESEAEPPTPGGGLSKSTRSKTKGTERGGVSVVATETLRIIADETNNALLIMAKVQDYKMIEAALKRLDVIPLQVLIEATVVDITLTDDLRYGIEWLFRNSAPGSGNIGQGKLDLAGLDAIAPGFSYALMSGNRVRAVLNALADQGKLNVLSSPSLMVLDNQTATIKVVDEVPVITQARTPVDTVNQDSIDQLQSVEFKEVGVILEVTPRVNLGGRITLDLSQEVSEVDRTPARVNTAGNPSFIQRNVQTTVTVQSGESLVLGGLISETKIQSNSGIPFLKDIPVLGALFSQTRDFTDRQELIVLLTPRAVRDEAEARAVTEEFRHRLRELESIKPGG
ncbi:MAG: Type II secretion system protein D [Chromatiales bacterium USCg_Taylor]|nr:MAG: Type II secretion system protein D [Chromatiales bacterium USCg_Taylor]